MLKIEIKEPKFSVGDVTTYKCSFLDGVIIQVTITKVTLVMDLATRDFVYKCDFRNGITGNNGSTWTDVNEDDVK